MGIALSIDLKVLSLVIHKTANILQIKTKFENVVCTHSGNDLSFNDHSAEDKGFVYPSERRFSPKAVLLLPWQVHHEQLCCHANPIDWQHAIPTVVFFQYPVDTAKINRCQIIGCTKQLESNLSLKQRIFSTSYACTSTNIAVYKVPKPPSILKSDILMP